MTTVDEHLQQTEVEHAQRYEDAATYIEKYGLWQGAYFMRSEIDTRPGDPCCGVGTLAMVLADRPDYDEACRIAEDSTLLLHARRTLSVQSGVRFLPSFLAWSDNRTRDGSLPTSPGRLAAPQDAARVAALFRATAARIRAGESR